MEQGMGEETRSATRRRPGAERLLEAASILFYREGINAVGVDTISEKAGVSKRTLYNRFGGKDDLVAQYLRRRDERWRAYLQEVTEGLADPREELLAVFGAYEQWLIEGDYRGCPFVNAAAELPDSDHPARLVVQRHKKGIENHLAYLAGETGVDEPEALAQRLLILLEGATATAAVRRSPEPLQAARSVALELIEARSR